MREVEESVLSDAVVAVVMVVAMCDWVVRFLSCCWPGGGVP